MGLLWIITHDVLQGEVDLHHPRQLSSVKTSYLENEVIETDLIAFEFLKDTTFLLWNIWVGFLKVLPPLAMQSRVHVFLPKKQTGTYTMKWRMKV